MEDYIKELKSLIDVSSKLDKNDFLNTVEDRIISIYNPDRYVITPEIEAEKLQIITGIYALVVDLNYSLEEFTNYLIKFPKPDLISFLYLILKNAKTNSDH